MQSKILVGSYATCEAYIEKYITAHNIPSFSITKLSETIKIEDIHKLIYQHRIHAGKSEQRLIVLYGEITIPAQNALLKFLEELPESDSVFFCVESEGLLLETIRSRCSIVQLIQEVHSTALVFDTTNMLMQQLIQKAQYIKTQQDYYLLVSELRSTLIYTVLTKKRADTQKLFLVLKELHMQTQFVRENNLNPQFTVEAIAYKHI